MIADCDLILVINSESEKNQNIIKWFIKSGNKISINANTKCLTTVKRIYLSELIDQQKSIKC